MDKTLLVIMVTFSLFCTGGCYKSVCADPVCREVQPVDGDAGNEQSDSAVLDGGETPEEDAAVEDAAVIAIDPDCPPPPANPIPRQWFAHSSSPPAREHLKALAMAGTCQPTVFALADIDGATNEGLIQSVTFATPSSTTTGDDFLTMNGFTLAQATFGLVSYTKGETSRHTYLDHFNPLGENEIGTVIYIPNDQFVPFMAESPTDPTWVFVEHLNAGSNALRTRPIADSGLSGVITNYSFSMPTSFRASEVVGFNQGFAIKLARIENGTVIGEILFLRATGADRVTFARQQPANSEDIERVMYDLLYLHSDIAPHPDGVLIATNDEAGASAYLLRPDGSKHHVINLSGTASAVALLPYGFAAASYEDSTIHLVIRETTSNLNHWHDVIAPYPVADHPRIASANYGYRLGVTVSYVDTRTNTLMMQVRNFAHLP